MGTVISLCARRQELTERLCGVSRFSGARVCDGRVVVSTSLDDEAMVLTPDAARVLGLALVALADEAEGDRG